ncbi:MAG: hypothetical protein E3K37_03590 [Candidatus Kuenenia sp.]|nr:hypothetical protein [Candidatus Kuenenia hertensis]
MTIKFQLMLVCYPDESASYIVRPGRALMIPNINLTVFIWIITPYASDGLSNDIKYLPDDRPVGIKDK